MSIAVVRVTYLATYKASDVLSQSDLNRGCPCYNPHPNANMKFHVIASLLFAWLPLQAQTQEIVSEESIQIPLEESAVESVEVSRAVPSIIGPLAGEPRPAPTQPAIPPPPRLNIPAQNTLTSKNHQVGDHTVTIEEVIPVELPPHPAPPVARTAAQQQAFLQSRPARPKREMVNFSSTVYDHRATVIDWRSKDNTRSFRAWSNIDFNYIRGIHNIQHGDTHLIYFWLNRKICG